MTARQLTQFQKVFRAWQKRLGLLEYTVTFEQKKLPDCWAQLIVDPEGCVATLTLSTVGKWTVRNIKQVACHECIHLLLGRLTYLGHARFLNEGEIHTENERVTCVLEKTLWQK